MVVQVGKGGVDKSKDQSLSVAEGAGGEKEAGGRGVGGGRKVWERGFFKNENLSSRRLMVPNKRPIRAHRPSRGYRYCSTTPRTSRTLAITST